MEPDSDYRIEFDAKNRILLLTFQNEVTESSFLAGVSAATDFVMASHPIEGAIVDFSEIRELHLIPSFIRDYARLDLQALPWKPRVIVAPQPAVFGMARMFQTLTEGTLYVIGVVKTMDEAWSLLKLQSPEFKPVSKATGG